MSKYDVSYTYDSTTDTYKGLLLTDSINIVETNKIYKQTYNIFDKNTPSNIGFILFIVSAICISTFLIISFIVKKSFISSSNKNILLGLGGILFILNVASVVINGISITPKSPGSFYYLKDPSNFNKSNPDVIENVVTTKIDKKNLIFLGLSGVLLFMISVALFLLYKF